MFRPLCDALMLNPKRDRGKKTANPHPENLVSQMQQESSDKARQIQGKRAARRDFRRN
jgi:hypothetical protein